MCFKIRTAIIVILAVLLCYYNNSCLMSGILANLLRLAGDQFLPRQLTLIKNVSLIRCVSLLIKYIIHSNVCVFHEYHPPNLSSGTRKVYLGRQ